MADVVRVRVPVALLVGLGVAIVFTLGIGVASDRSARCGSECHPSAGILIRGECHCAVEGGWMIPPREQETEEVKD